jgi:hypothetical protein
MLEGKNNRINLKTDGEYFFVRHKQFLIVKVCCLSFPVDVVDIVGILLVNCVGYQVQPLPTVHSFCKSIFHNKVPSPRTLEFH